MGTDPKRLPNKEKTIVINALRLEKGWTLVCLLVELNIAKSSYEYQARLLTQSEKQEVIELKERIKVAFEEACGVYGYRRLLAELNSKSDTKISEWKLRKYMKELGLYGRTPKKKRCNSYVGETSQAPANTCVDVDGKHHFKTDRPNALWITDITEFAIPQGKVYLSPIIDCFDGMPISRSIGTSPNAELANSSLRQACLLRTPDDDTRIQL